MVSPPKFYTGVGSRNITDGVYSRLSNISSNLMFKGWILRTGEAVGSDEAFRFALPPGKKEVYRADDLLKIGDHWSYDMVKKYLPIDRSGFDNWKPYVKSLLARDMMQVLGADPETCLKSSFLVCWAPSSNYQDSSAGGTGYAIRCALGHDVPVYNLFIKEDSEKFDKMMESL